MTEKQSHIATKTRSQECDPFLTQYFYHDILPNGNVARMKLESGVPVVVEDLGKARDWIRKAMTKAMLMRPEDAEKVDISELTHIELASMRLAMSAAAGCLKSTQELLDRVLGKPKQVNENYNASVSLDDILLGKDRENEKGAIDVEFKD